MVESWNLDPGPGLSPCAVLPLQGGQGQERPQGSQTQVTGGLMPFPARLGLLAAGLQAHGPWGWTGLWAELPEEEPGELE